MVLTPLEKTYFTQKSHGNSRVRHNKPVRPEQALSDPEVDDDDDDDYVSLRQTETCKVDLMVKKQS